MPCLACAAGLGLREAGLWLAAVEIQGEQSGHFRQRDWKTVHGVHHKRGANDPKRQARKTRLLYQSHMAVRMSVQRVEPLRMVNEAR